jgi:hypothetical protein
MLYWFKPPSLENEMASFEVDVEAKMIRSMSFDDPALWRDLPRIDVPQ